MPAVNATAAAAAKTISLRMELSLPLKVTARWRVIFGICKQAPTKSNAPLMQNRSFALQYKGF
jgi:hypothetical protein